MVAQPDPADVAQLRTSIPAWNDAVKQRVSVDPLWRPNLARANLARANLAGADLIGADLSSADLTHAYLTRANLTSADLTHANLAHADLTRAGLTDANLTRANLTRADLTDADLTRANLARPIGRLRAYFLTAANLTGANLTRANLTDANLTRANLTDANLTSANLTRANLTRAILTFADLTDADLTDANLTETDLNSAARARAKRIAGGSIGQGERINLRLRISVDLGHGEPVETVSQVAAGVTALCRLAARVGDRLSPGHAEQGRGVITATDSDAGDDFRVAKAHYGSPFYIEFLQAIGPLEVAGGSALVWAVRDLTRGLEASKLINLLLTLCRRDERDAFLEGRIADRRAINAEHQAREARANLETEQHREGITVLRLERAPTTDLAQAAAIIDPDAPPDVRLETTEHLDELQPLLNRRVTLEVVADR